MERSQWSLANEEYWTDGGCTFFPDSLPIFGWDWTDCCIAHDFNAGDWYLFTCIIDHTSYWIIPVVGICIGLMALGRPIYQIWLKKQGHKV